MADPDQKELKREEMEKLLSRAIASRSAVTAEQREQIYAVARQSAIKSGGPDGSKIIDEAIASIEESFRAPTESLVRRARLPLIAAICLAMGLAAGWAAGAGILKPVSGVSAGVQGVQTLVDKQAALVPLAEAYMRKVLDAILARPRTDPLFQEKTFVALQKYFPDLLKEMPEGLPRATSVSIRSDGGDVKVIMNYPFCPVVQIVKPALVDPVRSWPDTLGCGAFGVWTDGAAKW